MPWSRRHGRRLQSPSKKSQPPRRPQTPRSRARAATPGFAERFAREAQALAALNHPNIVTIFDFGQAGGFYFLLMEFVDGVNLRQLLRSRKFSPEEALAIVPPLCDALQFAHDRGIVHRDIKPENLLLDKAGRIKVADFGIARMLGGDPAGPLTPDEKASEVRGQELTQNTAMGTPGYSAPEQRSDPRQVDSRADIYSLGVVFYEMLTGELPGKAIEPPSRKVQIDVRLDEIVLRALEKLPELRFQQVSEVKTLLETISTSHPPGRFGRSARISSRHHQIFPDPNSHFSRTAILGALWAPLLVIMLLTMFMPWTGAPTTYGGTPRWRSFCMFLFAHGLPMAVPDSPQWQRFTLLPLGLLAPLGTTVLGWLAASQIRRARKTPRPAWPYSTDFYIRCSCWISPNFAFLWTSIYAIARLPYFRSGDETTFPRRIVLSIDISEWTQIWICVSVLLCIVADFLIVRRIWRCPDLNHQSFTARIRSNTIAAGSAARPGLGPNARGNSPLT